MHFDPMNFVGSLAVACVLAITTAHAAENQPTTNRLQQQTPDAPTTNSLNKPEGEQTTTGLAASSRKQPTTNNLQAPPQPAPSGSSRR